MEKSILEKRITEKAEKRFRNDYLEAWNFINRNPILKNLTFKIRGITEPMQMIDECMTDSIFQNYQNFAGNENLIKASNILEVKKQLIGKYEIAETDELLNKIQSIDYLFDKIK